MDALTASPRPSLGDDETSPARIVVVDDDPGIRDVISDFLIRNGYEVDQAADMPGLQQALGRGRADLLVLT